MTFTQICIAGVDGHKGLNLWEGRLPFLYLDSRKINDRPAPLPTIGIGCAVDLNECLGLPFTIQGRPATQVEIAADLATLTAAPFGYVAAHYASYTRIRLDDVAIDALMQKRFAVLIAALRREHPGFDSMPETAKAGCLDLIYGLGILGYTSSYHVFRADIDQRNFAAAALQCAADAHIPAYDDRNQARKLLFLAAAKG